MATRSVGRPRLNRDLQSYIPRLESDLHFALTKRADEAGLRLGGYLAHVLSEAHGYRGPFLQDLPVPLPLALPPARLRQRAADLGATDCTPVTGKGVPAHVRVDRPVAKRIQARVDEIGCEYAAYYLRAVFRAAVGFDQPGQGIQTPLPEEWMGGLQRRRSA